PFPELDSERTLVVVFGAPAFVDDPSPLEELRRRYPRSKILGCSTAGEIFGDELRDGSLSVGVVRFESSELVSARARVANAGESHDAGTALARALARPDLRGVIVLSDGLHVNGSELVRGLSQGLPDSVVVT